MAEKTLYVTDLDGTLLHSNQLTSDYTNQVVNRLVHDGMIFSYATARSLSTAEKVTKGLNARFPIIAYNGAFIIENHTGKRLCTNLFIKDEVEGICSLLKKYGVDPIVYALIDGNEKFTYNRKCLNKGMRNFIESRQGDDRNHPVDSVDQLFMGDIFYFTCIDSREKLLPLYNEIKNTYNCIFDRDIYSKEQWLEIMPKAATKAKAILQLKEMLGCNKVVSFGDGKNDISMFHISDECYAVENASDKLKEIATDIIESNNHDGVAKWLDRHVKNNALISEKSGKESVLHTLSPSFSGIVTGLCKGKCWTNHKKHPTIAVAYSHPVGGFCILGKAANKKEFKELEDYLNNDLFYELRKEGIREFEFSVQDKTMRERLLESFSYKNIMSEEEYSLRAYTRQSDTVVLPEGYRLVEADETFFQQIDHGAVKNSTMLLERIQNSWDSVETFLTNSIAFAVVKDKAIVAVIVGTARYDVYVPIDIETEMSHRKKGLATALTKAFINRCLEKELIAQWDCVESNMASRASAKKCGFHFVRKAPYYWFEI